ncbi:glycosyltransferase family 2 protein [uncultured Roseobacter sp.]|uniref:glycosyltransferase family 2 protein n=1 Tax=uncultured Roseobacter sp. TaxID=114847 RepID=UPI00262C3190|nr:glycosyltransferase family 2 protein [uncultured Roseobacter sp.]
MRIARKHLRIRCTRKSFELRRVVDRTARIGRGDILLVSTMRNENIRLPYFLQYYRDMGVSHFLIVDNDSDDGGPEYLAEQPDVSLWRTGASYRKSRFGVDWQNYLLGRYGRGHWCLTVDPDEFFVYPFCDTRPLRALTDWLDSGQTRSFSAMLLDMYPKGRLADHPYQSGQDPIETACWFDSGNYSVARDPRFRNLWIQGGPRGRVFFRDTPEQAPALNKIPLVKWSRGYAYVQSTHMLLPRVLNKVYDPSGGEKTSGVLLHTKFLDTFGAKAAEEISRQQHYAAGAEYQAYAAGGGDAVELWCPWSERYLNWRQLEVLGLMSQGNWA